MLKGKKARPQGWGAVPANLKQKKVSLPGEAEEGGKREAVKGGNNPAYAEKVETQGPEPFPGREARGF